MITSVRNGALQNDLKIVSIAPLSRVLLPKSLASLAMEVLTQEHLQSSTDEDNE